MSTTPKGGSVGREARVKRDGRAEAVAQLLRAGWSGKQVSAMLEVTDHGGSVAEAFAAAEQVRANPPEQDR